MLYLNSPANVQVLWPFLQSADPHHPELSQNALWPGPTADTLNFGGLGVRLGCGCIERAAQRSLKGSPIRNPASSHFVVSAPHYLLSTGIICF